MRTQSRRLPVWATVLAVGIGVSACQRDEAASTTAAPTTAPTTPVSSPGTTTTTIALPDKPDVLRMPLTGQPIESTDEIPQRPALVVKVPMDDPAAMPHTGLNQADIVFQVVINDSFTRLIAVFHTQGANPVGPIRSGRDQDIPIVAEFERPLVGWSGGNPGVNKVMREAAEEGLLVDLSYTDHPELFQRRSDRGKAPHNLFTGTDALWAAAPEEFDIPKVVFPYLDPDQEPDGDPAEEIDVALDSIRSHWEYDEDTGRYLKWNNGKPHQTESDGQVWADNVVVPMIDYGISPIDAQNPLADSLGSNPVYIFSRGTVRIGSWVRFAETEGWGFYDDLTALNEIGLVPGRTWVEMPRNKPGVLSYRSDGTEVKPKTGPATTVPPAPAGTTTTTTKG